MSEAEDPSESLISGILRLMSASRSERVSGIVSWEWGAMVVLCGVELRDVFL